ncbi:MAG: DUF4399 domain-containing protein [Bdellovibrionales bacterium]|nr:DUF4399 domain-containing protein [Bdellovibrionales bacterium]
MRIFKLCVSQVRLAALSLLFVAGVHVGSPVLAEEVSADAAGEAPGVFFQNIQSGDEVKSPVVVHMGVRGKSIAPAGELVPGTGHHHIVIDGTFVPEHQVVPADATHLHFGKGQVEAEVPLSPGKHTLTLQLADGLHQSYGEAWSKTIEVTVVE